MIYRVGIVIIRGGGGYEGGGIPVHNSVAVLWYKLAMRNLCAGIEFKYLTNMWQLWFSGSI